MLTTTINVFGMIVLDEYESGLTRPLLFYDFSGAKGKDKIEFQYCFKGQPGIQILKCSLEASVPSVFMDYKLLFVRSSHEGFGYEDK